MIGYILYGIILAIVIILIIKINNELLIIKIFSILSFLLSFSVFFIGYLIKIIIDNKINFINSMVISNFIFNKFIAIGFINLIIGLLFAILYILLIIIYKKRVNK